MNKSIDMKRLLGICLLLGLTTTLTVCSRPRYRADHAESVETEAIVCPKISNERELATWATPVAGLGVRPGHFSEAEYYAAPSNRLSNMPFPYPKPVLYARLKSALPAGRARPWPIPVQR